MQCQHGKPTLAMLHREHSIARVETISLDTQAAQSSDAPRSPPGKGKGPTAPARGKGGKAGKGAGKGTDQGEAGQARNEGAGQGQKGPPLPAKGAGKGADEGDAGRVIEVGSLGRKLSLKSATGRMGCLSLLNQARSGRPTRIDPTRVDFDTMLTTFAQDRAPPRAHVFMRKQPEVKILPDALAQNLGIVLKTLGADTHKAVVSFVFLDNVLGFDAEVAGRLKDAWPDSKDTQKQIQALHDYVRNPTANIAGLREIDRQMMLFALIPRLLPRIRIFCMMNGLEERKTEAFRKLRDLSTTLNRLRASETLKHIIAVVTVLYNYINHETHPDAARQLKGVDISSLAALRNTKCNTGVGPITNYNMLHFAIQQMLQQDPTRTLQEFQDDVRGLRDHKGLKWETCMQEAKRLQEDFSFVQRELCAHFEAYFDPDMELFEVALKSQPFAEVMLSHPYGEQVVLGIHSAYGEAYNTAKIFQSRLTAFFGSYTSELRILQRDMRAFVQHFGMKAGRHKTSPHTVELTTALLQFTDQVQSHWQDLLPKPKRNPSKSPRTSRTAGPSRRLSRTITRSSTEDTIPEEDTE
ncbi:FH3 [Symbiodinium sp. CCMP2592]|nr:FH3 [Symbiodinium sp. CCMP2592]